MILKVQWDCCQPQIYNPVNLYRLQFGEIHTEKGMDRVNRIGDILDSCKITAKKSENIIQDQWAKSALI
jgi:hypothetical protein